MKNKASLALMEQTIMVLVFALAAVLCLRVFVWADVTSCNNAARDKAVLHAQTAAETLKSQGGDYAAAAALCGGAWDGEAWTISYDEQWNETQSQAAFRLCVLPGERRRDYLGTARVEVQNADGTQLILLPVCWQEVAADA